jgi:hypothetical protein
MKRKPKRQLLSEQQSETLRRAASGYVMRCKMAGRDDWFVYENGQLVTYQHTVKQLINLGPLVGAKDGLLPSGEPSQTYRLSANGLRPDDEPRQIYRVRPVAANNNEQVEATND